MPFRKTPPGSELYSPASRAAKWRGETFVSSQIFSIEADGMLDFTTFGSTTGRIMGGAELFLAGHYAIRAGWRYDTGTTLNTPSLGLGYIDVRWSAELSFRHDLVSEHAATLGVLSLKYFYDAAGTTSQDDQPDAL